MTINEVAGKGETPVALNFQQAFNAPNSPWLTLVRDAVLGDGGKVDSRTTTRSPRCSGSSDVTSPVGVPARRGTPPPGPTIAPGREARHDRPDAPSAARPASAGGAAAAAALRGWLYATPTALFVARAVRRAAAARAADVARRGWPLLAGDQGINFPDNYVEGGATTGSSWTRSSSP